MNFAPTDTWYDAASPAYTLTKNVKAALQNFELADRLIQEALNALPETSAKHLAGLQIATTRLWLAETLRESEVAIAQINRGWEIGATTTAQQAQDYRYAQAKAGVASGPIQHGEPLPVDVLGEEAANPETM